MKQNAPTPCRAIQITTLLFCALAVGIFAAGYWRRPLLLPGAILCLVGIYCYWFWAPVAYELENGVLTVCFRGSRKTFHPVVRCLMVREPLSLMTVRLCGNGGVFSGSGIFWNKRYGVFRAYVTRNRPPDLLLLETPKTKVIISPENPAAFLQAAAANGVATGRLA